MFKIFFIVYLGDSDSERMGNLYVNYIIEKKICIENCLMYGEFVFDLWWNKCIE